jgi:hypothetical protein
VTEVLPARREGASLELLATLEQIGGVADERGLNLPPGLPYDQYVSIGAMLTSAERRINWFIGDWLVYGEHHYGHKFSQAAEITGKAPQTLMSIQSVARMVPPQRRRMDTVPFSHHYEIRGLPAADQKRILKRAETERLTKMQVRDLAKEANGEVVPRQEVVRDFCEACGRSY